ncbi:hypothetical protein GCM10027048_36480 [Hymenobacter coalescens]
MPIRKTGASALLLGTLLLAGCGKKDNNPPAQPAVTAISIASLTPAPGTQVSRATTIDATLNYSLADSETSAYGYRVSILFKSTTGSTFAINPSSVDLTARKGTVSMSYPLSRFWDRTTSPMPARPITCYFYLQRNTNGTGQSEVIAKTDALVFPE